MLHSSAQPGPFLHGLECRVEACGQRRMLGNA